VTENITNCRVASEMNEIDAFLVGLALLPLSASLSCKLPLLSCATLLYAPCICLISMQLAVPKRPGVYITP